MPTVLVLRLIVGAIVAFFALRFGETVRFETGSTPAQVTMAAVGVMANKRRWNTVGQGDGWSNFGYHNGPNKLLAVVGLLLFFIPGVVCIILAGKEESVAVNVDTTTRGITVGQVTSNGRRGKSAGRALKAQLGLAAGNMVAHATARPAAMGGALLEPALVRATGEAHTTSWPVAAAPRPANSSNRRPRV